MDTPNITKAEDYSNRKIDALRSAFSSLGLDGGISIVTVGSLARREASEQSDLDYFIICPDADGDGEVRNKINSCIAQLEIRPPSSSGAFATSVSPENLKRAIGGSSESNDELTRRMLFLLESDWLYGREVYEELFADLISLYIKNGITQHQLARFFLNDLIRYYRTICVDFEYKTCDGGKSWGDRNIKLLFSRKLLYFSGIVAVAGTAQSSCEFKKSELTRLLKMTPINRVKDSCGGDSDRLMARYDAFLGWMSDVGVRGRLRETSSDRNAHSDEFRAMKNAGHHFSWDIENLLHRCFAQTHPIYQALFL
ncbi:nucleotidyltransferase domain-containing protein [uncultured Xanthomonas sp.]|uniref:nucleotidyltransferase domain-containing protein n=1 Tax=uncultured Xanthomonas sp. TaxID=152831 RepID=UPI0025CCE9B5|nr:nucleotidyltransferase domain-containing protein [uncultured Xanthomonas sp.]